MNRSEFKDFAQCVLLPMGSIFAVIVLVFVGIEWATKDTPEERTALYQAWTKAAGNTNLTQTEFDLLERKRMLPGQSRNTTTVVPMPVVIPHR